MNNLQIDKIEQSSKLVKEFQDLNIKKEQLLNKENNSAITIQRVLKGFTLRKRLTKMNKVAIIIQRNVRGFLQRRRQEKLLKLNLKEHRKEIFSQQAIVIQRHFRGFESRKHIHNFMQRKNQLQKVVEKNNKVMQQVNIEAERQKRQHEIDEENKAQQEFTKQISNMHHLIGTAQINSVYNNPQEPEENRTKICGIGIEDHIRLQFRSSYGTKKSSIMRQGIKDTGTLERF